MFNFFHKSSKLSQEQAYEQLQNDKSIKLIDVRTRDEYHQGYIAKAINIPLDTFKSQIQKKVTNKDDKVFVVCLSGSRASTAVSYMQKVGYTQVFNIGGIATWNYGLTK